MIKACFIQKSLFWVITDTRTISRREYGHGIASQTRWKFNSSRPKRRILDEFMICVRTKKNVDLLKNEKIRTWTKQKYETAPWKAHQFIIIGYVTDATP